MFQGALPAVLLLFVGFLQGQHVSGDSKDTGGATEYYSSVAGLEQLLKIELVIVADLEHYIAKLQSHIEVLQSEVMLIREDHLTAANDVEGYLNNPVNAYRLIRRLHHGWHDIEDSVRTDTSHTDFLDAMSVSRQNFSFPTRADVVGSAMALVRLQDTYKLDVPEVAAGILNGVKYGPSMSWQDCFTLGHHLFEIHDFNHTVQWLKQSVQLLKYEPYHEDALLLDYLETISEYHQIMGDFETALEIIQYILTQDAMRLKLHSRKSYLEHVISSGAKVGLLHEEPPSGNRYHLTADFKRYEQVCRGELALSASQQRPLRCKYHTNNVPYRLLQPFKVEELYLDPYIAQIHDVLDVRNVNAVKRLARKHMSRSLVLGYDEKGGKMQNYRVSKSAWLDYTHYFTSRILSEMGDLSGLNIQSAEPLQVANYGIGGHYEPHFDFFEEETHQVPLGGNRIATGVFYLSDVEEGGGTAFPHLRVLVKPQRGSVLFWHNLLPSGDPDYRTRHAACPVLKGSKWIANVWVQERNQDRVRPCKVTRGHEVALMYKAII